MKDGLKNDDSPEKLISLPSDSLCAWALDWVSASNRKNRYICITMWAFEMPIPAAFQRKLVPAVE